MDKINKAEMLIRKSISEEEKAVSDYIERRHKLEKMLDEAETESFAVSINTYISVLNDIIKEEEVHVGQLRELLEVFHLSLESEQKGREETTDSYNEVLANFYNAIGEEK